MSAYFLFAQLQRIHKGKNTLNRKKEDWYAFLSQTYHTYDIKPLANLNNHLLSEVFIMATIQYEERTRELVERYKNDLKLERYAIELEHIHEPLKILNMD